MGYTHYWGKLKTNENLARITRKIVELGDVAIGNGIGKGEPIITKDRIVLNGSAEKGEDFETFAIYKDNDESYNFCKTGNMPYDKVVTAILCSALYMNCKGSETIQSDGGYSDWKESGGIDLFKKAYKTVFNKEVDNKKFTNMLKHKIGG